MFVKNYTTGKFYSYGKEISKSEYENILQMLQNEPEAPEGYSYFLNADLEWVLCELLAVEEEATDEDYRSALSEFGVKV